MLVLARKLGQRVRIAEDITITVLEISNGRVKLGISAPVEVPVHREELARRMGALPPALEYADCV